MTNKAKIIAFHILFVLKIAIAVLGLFKASALFSLWIDETIYHGGFPGFDGSFYFFNLLPLIALVILYAGCILFSIKRNKLASCLTIASAVVFAFHFIHEAITESEDKINYVVLLFFSLLLILVFLIAQRKKKNEQSEKPFQILLLILSILSILWTVFFHFSVIVKKYEFVFWFNCIDSITLWGLGIWFLSLVNHPNNGIEPQG